MTKAGWIFMLGAWAAITTALVYCFSLILRTDGSRDQAAGGAPPNA